MKVSYLGVVTLLRLRYADYEVVDAPLDMF
jgi:hypothetical protein